MPIDKDFRERWKKDSTHRGHAVWHSDRGGSEEIHGDIVAIHINSCTGCMKCIRACPVNLLEPWASHLGLVVDPVREADCIECLACELVCPTDAIDIRRQDGSEDTLDSLLRGE